MPSEPQSSCDGSLRRAVFLDRDGTLNVEKDYLYKLEDFEFIPGVPLALKRLHEAGFLLVIVTNQSGVARGYFALEDVTALHLHMQEVLRPFGVQLDGFYICPHHPTAGHPPYDIECDCRKGKPGLLLRAARELKIDLDHSFMVGDKRVDLEAGRSAGCRSLLVRTGYGAGVSLAGEFADIPAFDDFPAATEFLLS